MKRKRRKETNGINYTLTGLILVSISIGALFSIDLAQFAYFILLGTALVGLYYLNNSIISYYQKEPFDTATLYAGFLLLISGSVFIGIQSPQLFFKTYILIIGAVLLVIGWMKQRVR